MVLMLLNREIPDLPGGKPKKNVCIADAVAAFRESQKNVQEKNIEAVFQAISDGHCLNSTIIPATGLAKATVFNACQILLKADRVTVDKTRRPHAYFVKEK
jgi:hypothetical protein